MMFFCVLQSVEPRYLLDWGSRDYYRS